MEETHVEQAEQAQAPEVEAPEATQTEETATEEAVEFYTPEEVREIGIDKLDANRIPEELKPYYKSMQADYTRKTQGVAELRKELLEVAEAMKQTTPKAPEPTTIEDMYLNNPQKVTQEINQRIAALVADDPYGNAVEIEQLRDLKVNLVETRARRESEGLNITRTVESHQKELVKAIPDFETKKDALLKFATEELGWSPQMVLDKSDYLRHGAEVNKFIVGLNKMYDKINAPKTLSDKKTQPKPTQVEAPGSGFKAPAGPTYQQLFAEAKETGDWTKVLKAKGY